MNASIISLVKQVYFRLRVHDVVGMKSNLFWKDQRRTVVGVRRNITETIPVVLI